MHTYICFYNRRQIELRAANQLAARDAAAAFNVFAGGFAEGIVFLFS